MQVRSFRIVKPCTSDGFFKTCTDRKQPYALAVQGPLVTRDGVVVPPIFTSFQGVFQKECVGNITLCAALEDAKATAANVELKGSSAAKGVPRAMPLAVLLCGALAALVLRRP